MVEVVVVVMVPIVVVVMVAVLVVVLVVVVVVVIVVVCNAAAMARIVRFRQMLDSMLVLAHCLLTCASSCSPCKTCSKLHYS